MRTERKTELVKRVAETRMLENRLNALRDDTLKGKAWSSDGVVNPMEDTVNVLSGILCFSRGILLALEEDGDG